MATVYKADNYATPMPNCPFVGLELVREFLFTVGTAFVINDTVKLCPIPGTSLIVVDEWMLDIPDLDTGATPVIELALGDTDSAAKFMAAVAVGGAAAAIKTSLVAGVVAALPVEYSADKDLILKVTTAPQTGATAVTIKGWMKYHHIGVASPV